MFQREKIAEDRIIKIRSLLEDHIAENLEVLNQELRAISDRVDTSRIYRALDFAMVQDYGTGELYRYYVTHPLRVTLFMLVWMKRNDKYSTDALVASLVHNAIEKKVLSVDELERNYGPWVSHVIEVLTQDRIAMKEPEHKKFYYEKINKLDAFGQLIKYYDKLDNILALPINPNDEIRENYLREIEEYIVPICHNYDPENLSYLSELITDTRQAGHMRPIK